MKLFVTNRITEKTFVIKSANLTTHYGNCGLKAHITLINYIIDTVNLLLKSTLRRILSSVTCFNRTRKGHTISTIDYEIRCILSSSSASNRLLDDFRCNKRVTDTKTGIYVAHNQLVSERIFVGYVQAFQ
ncbi:CLUMA_CG006876, isoform A [Clunio marinus]|uniref:CLUMA_CG006876, isoform A n=1 Tax=Clunio marinus TaxID=568069 RepID=A0A1J1HZ08_9DIPT|nr:CLUMA_CG006876, isoform A [Clunio marinus]